MGCGCGGYGVLGVERGEEVREYGKDLRKELPEKLAACQQALLEATSLEVARELMYGMSLQIGWAIFEPINRELNLDVHYRR